MTQLGFPRHLLSLVRCSGDGGELTFASDGHDAFVTNSVVQCIRCAREYRVRDGILSLLQSPLSHPESANEMRLRDAQNESILAGARPELSSAFADAVEVQPTLSAMRVEPGMIVGELGSGTGRFTLALAERAAAVIAIDFSLAGLQVLRQKLGPTAAVGLVQADVTEPYAGPGAFDRVLSTLHCNLPGRDQRMASLRHVAQALKDDGRGVISMHHYSLRDAVSGTPAAGRYRDGGIYRYYLREAEAKRETLPFFEGVRFVYLAADVPRVKSSLVARAISHLPVARAALGRLFLAITKRPRRLSDPR